MEQYVFVRLYARLSEEQAVEDALARSNEAVTRREGLLELSLVSLHAGYAAVLYPFTLGGRSSVSETGGFRAHGALSEEGRPLAGAAARGHSNAEDCLFA